MDPFAGWFGVWRGPSAGSGSCHVGLLSWKLEGWRPWRGPLGQARHAREANGEASPSLREGQERKGRGGERRQPRASVYTHVPTRQTATCLCLH